ncbi:MAG TPA: NAD-dependent epimerase/dehydratase family protein [Actinomycetota bacterium]|nr:NAD-dependent epimerase/dehydratase family protein [Actinomycetota bacterium]
MLVTGAGGLLGGWVTQALAAAGSDVVGLDNAWTPGARQRAAEGVQVFDGDVRDLDCLRDVLESGIDTVLHLAAQPIVGEANEDPIPTFDNNIAGTWTLLEACRLSPAVQGILVASSDKAYGDAGSATYSEDMPLKARHPYAASKACTDLLAQTYAESYGTKVVISRCGNLYGGGDRNWSRIVPGTIRSALEGRRPIIRSDGTPVRDYLYVEDIAAGMLLLSKAIVLQPELRGEAFNFGGGDRVAVLDVVTMILGELGSELEPDIRCDSVNEIPEQRVGAEKAQAILGWRPTHGLPEGLHRTVAWYREHLASML